ncbi:MAG: flagellar export protein FliJ [Candidatus Eremiobacteraeota bacterium]|nr:flagellar export protein FliJ [Candidatus Eremiobacteraeota bacterium]
MRKRKVFGLEEVLEHRRSLEDAALAALSLRRQAYLKATRKLELLTIAKRGNDCNVPAIGQAVSARDLRIIDRHARLLDSACAVQVESVAKREADVESARDAAFVARRARKIIETLRDRRLATIRAAENRAEQTELDEANQARRR